MRDWAILWILGAFIYASWRRPWLGVLALAVFAYMQPQGYGWEAVRGMPVFLILFLAVAAATAYAAYRRELTWPDWDWRVLLLLLLWGWFCVTTWQSKVLLMAWPKLIEVTKVLLPLALTLLLIDSRKKLLYLIAAIAMAIGLVTLKGGYWAVMHGFSDRVYGPPHSQYYDNNHFAVLMVMNIPLLILLLRETANNSLRWVLMVLIGLHYAAVISSWSRGAMLALGATTLILLWRARRPYLFIGLLLVGVAGAFLLLPDAWFQRMETIATEAAAGSTAGRLRIWHMGIDAALHNPLLGLGFEGWWIAAKITARHAVDWHSIYVEILAEHGFPGLLLWLALLLGTLFGLTRLIYLSRRGRYAVWAADYGAMLQAALIGYAVGGAFLGISYWNIFYHLIILAIIAIRLAQQTSQQNRQNRESSVMLRQVEIR